MFYRVGRSGRRGSVGSHGLILEEEEQVDILGGREEREEREEREGFKLKRSGNGGGAVIDKKKRGRSIDYWAGLKRGRALLYPRGEREK